MHSFVVHPNLRFWLPTSVLAENYLLSFDFTGEGLQFSRGAVHVIEYGGVASDARAGFADFDSVTYDRGWMSPHSVMLTAVAVT